MRFALPPIRLSLSARRMVLATMAAITATAAQPLMPHATMAAQELGIALGAVAPGAPLETLDGKAVNLKDYLGKQPVVLEFWATWCENCKELQPRMNAAAKKYSAQVKFVSVAVSVNQSVARVKAWQTANPLPMEILYDRKGDASEAYDAPATSYVVVVNKAGKVVYTGVGGTQDLDAAIRKAM